MAEKLDLDALERANLGKTVRPEDWIALLSYARELERASQTGSGEADTARLDFLDKYAVIAKPGQSVRETIDEARAAMGGKEGA